MGAWISSIKTIKTTIKGDGGTGGGVAKKSRSKQNNKANKANKSNRAKQNNYDEKCRNELLKLGFRKCMMKHVAMYDNESLSILHVAKDLAKHADLNPAKNPRELLRLAGFKPLKRFVNVLTGIFDHYSNDQLVDILIEYASGKHTPMRSKTFQHPFNDGVTDFFYMLPDGQGELRDCHDCQQIHHANIKELGIHDLLLQYSTIAKKPIEQLYFHATSWRGAVAIHNSGPLHNVGRPCLDFGITQSFYMTPLPTVAMDWAKKQGRLWSNESAIVVFSLPMSFMHLMHSMHSKQLSILSMTQPTKKWASLVSASRRCLNTPNEMDEYDLVSGPMVANPKELANGHFNSIPRAHNPPRMQLASKTRQSDRMLKECMVAIIWINK